LSQARKFKSWFPKNQKGFQPDKLKAFLHCYPAVETSRDIFLPSSACAEYDVALKFPANFSLEINLVLSSK
jgi:hypothetical protein